MRTHYYSIRYIKYSRLSDICANPSLGPRPRTFVISGYPFVEPILRPITSPCNASRCLQSQAHKQYHERKTNRRLSMHHLQTVKHPGYPTGHCPRPARTQQRSVLRMKALHLHRSGSNVLRPLTRPFFSGRPSFP